MSDNQRRSLCRILFLAMCVFPTSAIGYWICHPQTATGWERAIQAQLGVTTRIDSVETPGPYVTILRNLEFLDPDGETLFRTVTTEVEFGSEFNRIVIPNKVHGLTNEGLAYLIHTIDQNVIRKRTAKKRWTILFEENATIERDIADEILETANQAQPSSLTRTTQLDSSLTVSELRIDVGPSTPRSDGTSAEANFKVVDPNGIAVSDKLVACHISKTDQDGNVMWFNTNESSLPCWLFPHSTLDLASAIGPGAKFNGALRFEHSTSAHLELAGVFQNVDLATSIAVIDHSAWIQMNRCKFENGELTDWDAFLYADSDSTPRRIGETDLFTRSRKLDIAGAINKTLFAPKLRSARLESDSNNR